MTGKSRSSGPPSCPASRATRGPTRAWRGSAGPPWTVCSPTRASGDGSRRCASRDPAAAGSVADAVLAGAPPGTVAAETWEDQRDLALQEAAPLQLILSMYTVMLLAVVFAVVGILVGARVLEQNREIGLLKAVGLTPRQVTAVFVIESGVLGVLATGVGYVVGTTLAPLVAGVDGRRPWWIEPTSAGDPAHLLVAGLPVRPGPGAEHLGRGAPEDPDVGASTHCNRARLRPPRRSLVASGGTGTAAKRPAGRGRVRVAGRAGAPRSARSCSCCSRPASRLDWRRGHPPWRRSGSSDDWRG